MSVSIKRRTRLPPELIPNIIRYIQNPYHFDYYGEQVGNGDGVTLFACGLVSRDWLYPSRSRLFDVVKLRAYNIRHIRAFIALLNSHLCTFRACVRQIAVHVWLYNVSVREQRLFCCALLKAIDILKLTTLSFPLSHQNIFTPAMVPLAWPFPLKFILPKAPELRLDACLVIRNLRLHYTEINDPFDFLGFLNNFHALEELALCNVVDRRWPKEMAPLHLAPACNLRRLTTLDTTACELFGLIPGWLTPVDGASSCVDYIHMWKLETNEYPALNGLLESSGPALTNLHIGPWNPRSYMLDEHPGQTVLDFSSNSNLVHLTLAHSSRMDSYSFFDKSYYIECFWPYLLNALDTTAFPSLKYFRLELTHYDIPSLQGLSWSALDSKFILPRFPRLETAAIVVNVYPPKDLKLEVAEVEEVEEGGGLDFIWDGMPYCRERQVLSAVMRDV